VTEKPKQKGNTTNHPSRKGVKLKPEDIAKTKSFPGVRLTPDDLTRLHAVLSMQCVKVATWVENHIKADFANLTEDAKTHTEKAKTHPKTT